MKVKIYPSIASGTVGSQPSKSSMQRAIAAALLAKGTSSLSNISVSDDSLSALKMAECLGATIVRNNEKIEIIGGLKEGCNNLYCGESGLGVRLFSAIASLRNEEITLSGSGSIMTRPMTMIEDSLKKLGVKVETSNGYLPLKIQGPIKGGEIEIDGSLSSQLISGLLFALPMAEDDSLLKISSLNSKPYIDLTVSVLRSFGIEIENRDYSEIFIKGRQSYLATDYRIEEDWSGIAFLAVLGAISGGVRIKGLSHSSIQADRAIVNVLKSTGSQVEEGIDELIVPPGDLRSFNFDIKDCPDLAPPLAALASFCDGKSTITGTQRLESKESNRSLTLQEEFSKLGLRIDVNTDFMVIHGGGPIRSGIVESRGDHRIAMALALLATRSDGQVVINGAEVVNKSYPGFYSDIKRLGIKTEII
jgi:3-phosphoshikimate 1-carboxyvinyltransferase